MTIIGGGSGGENGSDRTDSGIILESNPTWQILTALLGKTVTIEACGAGGENGYQTGGNGAYVKKSVNLGTYTHLNIVIGERGKTAGEQRCKSPYSCCTGASGGGATYIYGSDNINLITAGGGGEGECYAGYPSVTGGGGKGEAGGNGAGRFVPAEYQTTEKPSIFGSYCSPQKQGAARISSASKGGNGGASGKIYVYETSVVSGTNLTINIGKGANAESQGEKTEVIFGKDFSISSDLGTAKAGNSALGSSGGSGAVANNGYRDLCTSATVGQDANGSGCGGGGGSYPNNGGKGSNGYVLIEKI